MQRRDFLKSAMAASAAATLPGLISCSGKAKPNLILINVDDLGWYDLGCYGSRYHETPNIDSLSAGGVTFTNAYAAASICSPTRAALMTGKHPARLGITDWIHHLGDAAKEAIEKGQHPTEYVGDETRPLLCPPNPYWLDLEEITLAEMLKDSGYTTAHIGKWHLGDKQWYPEHQGFDLNKGGAEIGQPPSYFDPYFLNDARPEIPTLAARQEGEYLTDRESDEALAFIRANSDKPFFLNMCHYAVHTPIQGKEELVEKYQSKTPSTQKNATYAAMLESVDQAVGRLLTELDDLGIRKETMILFTSDNGGLEWHDTITDNGPLRGEKGYAYEGGIRIPLILNWPGQLAADKKIDQPVISMDSTATLAQLGGAEASSIVDGHDLLSLVLNDKPLEREALYWHFPHYRLGREILPYSIIRKGDWKLIKRWEGPAFELYNLAEDMSESNDLSQQKPELVAELDADLSSWLTDVDAKLPIDNPEYIAPDEAT
jgi:arylsulfatase A